MTLTIAHLHATYHLPDGAERMALQARLDRVARSVPAVLAGRLQPAPEDREAVYRIRHLQLDLWVDALGMSDADIAERWGALLLRGVTRSLMLGGPGEVVRYDNAAHFVAAFLGDLLAGHAWGRWMYEEFAPLRDLPVGQVAAQLLGARPALALPVARHLQRQGDLEALISRFQPADARLLWTTGLGHGSPPVALASGGLARLLSALRGLALESGGAAARARNLLRLFFAAALAQPDLASDARLAILCQHAAWLHGLWAALPVARLWRGLAVPSAPLSPELLAAVAALGDEAAAPRDWLRAALGRLAGREYIAQLLPVVAPEVTEPVAKGAGRGRKQTIASSFAGLALLLPTLRRLELHHHLSKAGLYQLLLRVVGRRREPLAWSDAGLAWLAGVAEPEAEQARSVEIEWPDVAVWGEGEALVASADAAASHLGPLPGSAIALLTLRHFVAGLRGLAGSSPEWLATQFWHQPGQLRRADDALHVQLGRLPLAVVLRMAGYDGEQGPLPWLADRALWIRLPEG